MFPSQALLRTRLQYQLLRRLHWREATPALRYVSSSPNNDSTSVKVIDGATPPVVSMTSGFPRKDPKEHDKPAPGGCEDGDKDDDDDDMEQEEMFVEAHESFEHKTLEWGGPRRGGRFPEPTRFGDWERKGRCTDF